MLKVAVVLPTYNGERFVRQQVESVVSQVIDAQIDIFIRDDGSTDRTADIIEQLARKYDGGARRVIQVIDGRGNVGVPRGFYDLVQYAEDYDYYSFCDQDDVWEPNKLFRAVEHMGKSDMGVPTVYCGSFDYCDSSGEHLRPCIPLPSHFDVSQTLFYTVRQGFTMVINGAARKRFIVDVCPGQEMHDRYLIRCGACLGVLLLDDEVTAHHVRHEEAVTSGDTNLYTALKYFVVNELLGDSASHDTDNLTYFLDLYRPGLSENCIDMLENFTCGDSIIKRLRKVFYPRRLRTSFGGELTARLLLLFGKI